MSVSAIFGVKILSISPNPPLRQPFSGGTTSVGPSTVGYSNGNNLGLMIECSSRPQKKATAHHRKTRPRKTQAWDRNRGPAVYPPLPSLPPEWTLVTDKVVEDDSASSSLMEYENLDRQKSNLIGEKKTTNLRNCSAVGDDYSSSESSFGVKSKEGNIPIPIPRVGFLRDGEIKSRAGAEYKEIQNHSSKAVLL